MANSGQVAQRVVDVLALVERPDGEVLLPVAIREAGDGVEGLQHLVEVHVGLHPAVGKEGAVLERRCPPRARGDLDVGLAQQRLLAQDRLRVGVDRRVLGEHLDRRRLAVGVGGRVVIFTTLPTEMPAMRTSDCSASWAACGKPTWKLYSLALSGMAPPKDSHRKRSSPKQERVKITITSSRQSVGACFCIRGSSLRSGWRPAGPASWPIACSPSGRSPNAPPRSGRAPRAGSAG